MSGRFVYQSHITAPPPRTGRGSATIAWNISRVGTFMIAA
jgi:hypothetical protein